MDWLRQNGYQDLLGRSCVVINHTAVVAAVVIMVLFAKTTDVLPEKCTPCKAIDTMKATVGTMNTRADSATPHRLTPVIRASTPRHSQTLAP